MSQTVVNDEPVQAYAGKLQYGNNFPTTTIGRLASELIFFGKLVITADADLAVGGAAGGPQTVALPTTAAEVLLAANAGGISKADPSVERTSTAGVLDNFGAYVENTTVDVVRKGQIWVQTEVAVTALSDGVFVRVATPGTIPIASLGSFTPTNTANHEPAPAGMVWAAAAVGEGGILLGLLTINLPA